LKTEFAPTVQIQHQRSFVLKRQSGTMGRNLFNNGHFSLGLLIILVGGLAIGSIGPFGQVDRFMLFERIGLWVVYLSFGLPLIWTIQRRFFALLQGTSPQKYLFSCVSTTLCATPILFLIVELIGYSQGRPFPPDITEVTRALTEVFGTIFVITLLLTMLTMEKKTVSTAKPAELQAPFHALQAEGHYTRVHRSQGSILLDMTFSNALRAVSDLDGARVHRSWWVAREYVGAVRRKGSAKELELSDDLKIPIARRRIGQLRQQGWNI